MPDLGIRRWKIFWGRDGDYVVPKLASREEFEVMPVVEHENAVTVKRQAFEVAEGGRKLWMARALIYEDALQRITNTDPAALDALRIASKALGDATEYENTGRVAFDSPLDRIGLPSSPEGVSS